jgi:hypothetical protein
LPPARSYSSSPVAVQQATLPASASHRNASETFRREVSATNPNYAHLGLWNVYLNPDMPNPQSALKGFVCATDYSVDQGLASTIPDLAHRGLRRRIAHAPERVMREWT